MNRHFGTPSKSDRIAADITSRIRNDSLESGQAILSINAAAEKYGVARATVVKAYSRLVKQGYIESYPKKGFFVVNRQPDIKLKVLLILHSFNAHFEILYNEFRSRIKESCDVEIYFHHYNPQILELIINRNISGYDLFVISSFNHPRVPGIIGRIPAGKVFIISRDDRVEKKYNSVVQDFYNGTFRALEQAKEKISKYQRFCLCFPVKSGHPETLKNGFLEYCRKYPVAHKVVDSLDEVEVRRGDAFLIIDDSDLVKLLKVCSVRKWKPGLDVGVVSYNETPLKEVIRDGITVISCIFREMAAEAAGFVKGRASIKKTVPIELINRNSL